jgi:two-component system, chemotaxis family, chemotaxis protein CheY
MEADTLNRVVQPYRTRPLVLVVEDDDVIRSVIAEVLEERGFGVHTAINGAEALALLDTVRPDVVVLDLLMPVMHGWAFMEEYAQKTHGQAIPIVVLSVTPILPRSFDRFGVQRCVGKPFDIDALVVAVTEACALVAA